MQFDQKMVQDRAGGQNIRQGAVGTRSANLQGLRDGLQAVGAEGEPGARQLERVDYLERGQLPAKTLELAAEEGQVEGGVVADQDGILEPRGYLAGNFGEERRTGQLCIGQPVDARRAG